MFSFGSHFPPSEKLDPKAPRTAYSAGGLDDYADAASDLIVSVPRECRAIVLCFEKLENVRRRADIIFFQNSFVWLLNFLCLVVYPHFLRYRYFLQFHPTFFSKSQVYHGHGPSW